MKKPFLRLVACLTLLALLAAAQPVPAQAAGKFQDVPAGCWAASSIDRAVKLGLFQGETESTFGLGHSMTRAAFVVVLNRLFGWEQVTPATGSYTDNQNPDAWYYSAVETAYRRGAITRQSSTFRPRDPITREEMAVMLVRALGYGSIAGLTQELPMPFTDVRTNAGYISMAYELGIINGVKTDTFAPDRAATREQAAVMLVRVYDKYYSAPPAVCGVLSGTDALPELSGYAAVAVDAARLSGPWTLVRSGTTSAEQAEAARLAIQIPGGKALLRVTGSEAALNGTVEETAKLIQKQVQQESWDGVLLDIPKVSSRRQAALTALVTALDEGLGEKLLYVAAEAPVWQGSSYGGYDYAALTAEADQLILRVQPYEKKSGSFVTAPPEPLEELYYALAQLKGTVDFSRVSLWITTTGSAWAGSVDRGSVAAQEIAGLLSSESVRTYRSARYAAPYLIREVNGSSVTVWYQDTQSAAERANLAGFFGVGGFCLSDVSSLADYGSGNLLRGLRS